jgi:CubicO group peptidase (beta-lactamase class C family)
MLVDLNNKHKQMFMKLKTTLGLLCILALSSCTISNRTAPASSWRVLPSADMEHVRSETLVLIRRLLDEELVPGLSLALVEADGPIWVEAFGVSNTQTGRRLETDSVLRAGSISKPITAMAIMQLQQRSLLNIDSSLESQLIDFSIKRRPLQSGPMTLKQVMRHRAGLPSDLLKGMYTDTPFTDVSAKLRDSYLASAPGTKFNYSNLGYDLLGEIIEQQTKLTFEVYIQKNLFNPLGMSLSGFTLTPEMRNRLADGHLDGYLYPQPPLRDLPALGLYTTAQDMGKLLKGLLQQEIPGLSVLTQQQMWRVDLNEKDQMGDDINGLGWFIELHPEVGKLVRHGGSTLLFGAEVALLPNKGLGVAVLANGAHSNHLTRELAATILSLAAKSKPLRSATSSASRSTPALSAEHRPSGSYATSLGLLSVEPDRHKLCACIIEQILDLTRFDDGSYALTQESAASLPHSYRILGELRFSTRQGGGEELLIARKEGQELVIGNKIDHSALNNVWRGRLGSYETINPDGDFTLENLKLSDEEGVICFHYKAPHLSEREIRLPLIPVSDSEALIQGVGRGAGETLDFIEINGKPCLRFSGYIGMPAVGESVSK